ncbi:MAG TPA: DUF4349 domain-containing protein [Dehalococcoidia bacterium]|nr:DUF4349 domain-containing protein [Dehalococcoidia bacterium]
MKKLIITTGLLGVACLLVITSCSSSPKYEFRIADSDYYSEEEAFRVWASESAGGSGSSTDIIVIEQEPPASSDMLFPESIKDATSGEGESQAFDIDTQRMIVRTGDIRMVVDDIAITLEEITDMAEDSGGYVVSSNIWKEDERFVGVISIRVPTELFDSTMRALRELAVEVVAEETSSQDVTEEYIDLEAKLRNLEATEEQLLVIMQMAVEVEDILEVQRELTNTRDEIERTIGRMQYLEQTTETSFISVQLTQSKLDVEFRAYGGRYITGGDEVIFVAEIVGGFAPYTYEWDFGDGNTSTEAIPAHTYNSAGDYTISLTVTDDRGNTDTEIRTDYIHAESGWSAGNIAKSAWKGLRTFGQVLADIIIWVGIFSPVIIVVGVVIYLVRRRIKRRKAVE